MKKIDYPKGTQYIQEYKKIFQKGREIDKMQKAWDALQLSYPVELGYICPDVNDILVADYATLVTWYNRFKQLPLATRNLLNQSLVSILDYDKWSDDIAAFFKEPRNGFKISSCHYCDLSYINVFEVDPDADALYFLNNADDDELNKLTKSKDRIRYIKAQREYKSKADYDRVATLLQWSPNKWNRTFKPNYRYRHHFDLDHVLPKSVFRLVGLCLYNFVPSCQICNQKLKKARILGNKGVPNVKLSPTSPAFDGMNKTEFHIIPKSGVMAGRLRPSLNPQDYELQLDSIDPDYNDFIKLFKLEERYQHHKQVALHWVEMKYKYTDSRIKMMAASLKPNRGFTFAGIKADIFQIGLYREGNMTLTKLREDMLK